MEEFNNPDFLQKIQKNSTAYSLWFFIFSRGFQDSNPEIHLDCEIRLQYRQLCKGRKIALLQIKLQK